YSLAPRDLHSFPTRRSSDLNGWIRGITTKSNNGPSWACRPYPAPGDGDSMDLGAVDLRFRSSLDTRSSSSSTLDRSSLTVRPGLDRKSTRLNSSHEWISYAV